EYFDDCKQKTPVDEVYEDSPIRTIESSCGSASPETRPLPITNNEAIESEAIAPNPNKDNAAAPRSVFRSIARCHARFWLSQTQIHRSIDHWKIPAASSAQHDPGIPIRGLHPD